MTMSEKLKLISKIETLGHEEHELIGVLIRFYQVNNSPHSLGMPYGCVEDETGLTFNLEDLPPDLVCIIKEFVRMTTDAKSI